MFAKKFFFVSFLMFSCAYADENCKIINTPYNPLKTDANGHYTPEYAIFHFMKGATNILWERVVTSEGFQPELAFSKIIAKWKKLAQAGFCPNKPDHNNVCKIIPLENKQFGLTYNDGPMFLASSLDFILEKRNELNSRRVCINVELEETPEADALHLTEEEDPILTPEDRKKRNERID